MAYRATLSNFLEELEGKQNNPKYLSGWSRALFLTTFLEKAVYLSMKSQSLSLYATPPPSPTPVKLWQYFLNVEKNENLII